MKETKMIKSYKDLTVWQKSIELVVAVYELTENFPSEEKFGLVSQMRRAAVSIPSNIAEGRTRNTRKDFAHFVHIAYGSAAESETQLIVVKRLPFGQDLNYTKVEELLNEILKMLGSLRTNLKTFKPKNLQT
jgi:four helix bundle protein